MGRVVIDLREVLGFDDIFFLEETNINMRKVWVIERESSMFYANQISKKNTPAKKKKSIQQHKDFINSAIEFIIDIFELNPIEYKDYFYNQRSFFDLTKSISIITGAILRIEPVKSGKEFTEEEYRRQMKERYYFLDESIKDFDFNEQKILTELHIAPSQFEQEDYYRMNEVLSAQSSEERPVTGAIWAKRNNSEKQTNKKV